MLSERVSTSPPTRTKVGGLNPLRMSIITVNVQGIKQCVDDMQYSDTNLNLKGDVGIIESSKKKNTNTEEYWEQTQTLQIRKILRRIC